MTSAPWTAGRLIHGVTTHTLGEGSYGQVFKTALLVAPPDAAAAASSTAAAAAGGAPPAPSAAAASGEEDAALAASAPRVAAFWCALKQLIDFGPDNDGPRAEFLRELHPIVALEPHPFVAMADGALRTSAAATAAVALVSPLQCNNVMKFLRAEWPVGPPPELVQLWLYMICEGTAHLHRSGFMHRDLKLENCLIGPDGVVRVCDLGMLRWLDTPETGTGLTLQVCTMWTRAPELLLLQQPASDKGVQYGAEVDVWSLGACAAALAHAAYPSEAPTEEKYMHDVFSITGKPSDHEWPLVGQAAVWERQRASLVRRVNAAALTPHKARTAKMALLSCGDFHRYGDMAATYAALRARVQRSKVPDSFWNLLGRMMEPIPARRAMMDEVMAHPYFEGLTPATALARAAELLPSMRLPAAPDANSAAEALVWNPVIKGASTAGAFPGLAAPPGHALATLLHAAAAEGRAVWGWPRRRAVPGHVPMPRGAHIYGSAIEWVVPLRAHRRRVRVPENGTRLLDLNPEVNAQQRAIVADWMLRMATRLHLQPAVMLDALQLVDRVLQAVRVTADHVQAVAAAALMLVAKLLEVYPPLVSDMVKATAGDLRDAELARIQWRLLVAIHGEVLLPVEDRLVNALQSALRGMAWDAGVTALAAVAAGHDALLPWCASPATVAAAVARIVRELHVGRSHVTELMPAEQSVLVAKLRALVPKLGPGIPGRSSGAFEHVPALLREGHFHYSTVFA